MLLYFSWVSCSPFAKFFLLKFVTRYGNQTPWVDQVTEIIKVIELPKSRFYNVVKELRSLGILEVHETNPSEVHQIRYQISIRQSEICSFVPAKRSHLHQNKIDELLTLNSRPVSKRPRQLTIPQRVLMIALLEEADAGGVIRNIGFSDLAQRTGLAIRQIKNQMAKLREFHYLRVSLPGGNTPGLVGRYNSVHALNLRHPDFNQRPPSGGIVIFRHSTPFIQNEALNYFHFQRRELLNNLSKQKRTSGIHNDQSDELLKLANQSRNLSIASPWIFLNWLCHDLASRALSELWKELSELPFSELTTIIGGKIRGEWLSVYRRTIEADDGSKTGRKKAVLSKEPELSILALIEMSMSSAVRDIAIGIKKALIDSKVLLDHVHKYHFQILPIPNKDEKGHFALVIVACNEIPPNQKHGFTLALGFDPKQGEITIDSIPDIYSLKHSTLEMTGLASPPLSCPILPSLPKKRSTRPRRRAPDTTNGISVLGKHDHT